MTQENKDALYREEFEKLDRGSLSKEIWIKYNVDHLGNYCSERLRQDWKIYLSARKKGEEEMDKLKDIEQALYKSEDREVRQHNQIKDMITEQESLKRKNESLKKELDRLNNTVQMKALGLKNEKITSLKNELEVLKGAYGGQKIKYNNEIIELKKELAQVDELLNASVNNANKCNEERLELKKEIEELDAKYSEACTVISNEVYPDVVISKLKKELDRIKADKKELQLVIGKLARQALSEADKMKEV